jgi:transcriptional regulator
MPRRTPDLLHGTLDLLILKTLAREPLHGWALARRIHSVSRDALEVNQGSLYPALYRLEDEDLITGEWQESDEGRTVKVYRLTAGGRTELARELKEWRRFSGGVNLVLATD